ncbi:hypothetical protein Bpfe_029283 [Biomphalaria pfeifferi]|uniref:UPAR/Ly6 domain-containing protein n=1 Tax=Biomphalaria pfeifferi TaxID=112525 RepID=A0AAD8EWG2_BIOPF|nr:hypothetical protein Bpfe_029283 [Biomphalaria pfeifferi]
MAGLSIIGLFVFFAVALQSVCYADCPSCDSGGTSCSAMRAYVTCLATKTTSAGCNVLEATAASALKVSVEATIKVGCTGCGLVSSVALVLMLNAVVYFGRKLV